MEETVTGKRRWAVARLLLFGAGAVWCAAVGGGLPTGIRQCFPDTGSYLFTGKFFVALWPFRAPGYSVFTRYTSLGRSGWLIAAAQAVVVVYVLHETCGWLIGAEGQRRYAPRYLLGVVCALAVLTSLPWEVSLLMPDVFAGVVFLAAFLLGGTDVRLGDGLGLARRIVLAAILTIAVAAHTSLLPIAGLFAVTMVIARFTGARLRGAAPIVSTSATMPAKAALAWLLAPILAAGLGTAALNYEMGMGFRLSPVGNEFLLARLVDDGLAKDFLQANCPQRGFLMCKRISSTCQMPQSWFLFYHPLLHDMEKHGDEINEIERGTLTAYPIRFAGGAVFGKDAGGNWRRFAPGTRSGNRTRRTGTPR